MTFIEMLQQGGYILPQYSSGQLTYQAPNTGMQSLQTMMLLDQNAQQRYIQGEQLNLQRSQNVQNMINSTVQNEMNRKTSERMQKQIDLSNQKLQFEMHKSILKDMDEERERLNSSFLLRDRLQIEKDLADQGLDEAGMLEAMKGDFNLDNYSKIRLQKRSFLAKQKRGFTNMQNFNQATNFLKKGEQQLNQVQTILKTNPEFLDTKTMEGYMEALNEAAKQTIDFENGIIQDLDFSTGPWPQVVGFEEFLNEKALKDKIDMDASINMKKLQNEMLQSDILNNKLKLDKQLQPFEIFSKMSDTYEKFGEASNVFTILATHFRGIDLTNPSEFMEAFLKAPIVVQESIREALKKDLLKEDNVKTIENLLVDAIKSGDQARINQATELYKMSKRTSHTVHSDINGNPVIKEGSLNVYPSLGVKKTASGNLKEINIVLPGVNPKIEVETSGKNKGKAKIVTSNKTYYQDVHIDEDGNHFLKITSPDVMAALIGKADGMIWDDTGMKSWIGINELKDYDNVKAGDAYIGAWGGFYDEKLNAILIPTSPYGDSQINTQTDISDKAKSLPD